MIKKIIQDISDRLVEFQYTVDKALSNQNLQFTAEIWTNDTNLPPSANNDKFKIVANNKFPFLYMKMGWYPKGDMKFELFRGKG